MSTAILWRSETIGANAIRGCKIAPSSQAGRGYDSYNIEFTASFVSLFDTIAFCSVNCAGEEQENSRLKCIGFAHKWLGTYG